MSCINTWEKKPFILPEITLAVGSFRREGCVWLCSSASGLDVCPREGGSSVLNPGLGAFGGCSGAQILVYITIVDPSWISGRRDGVTSCNHNYNRIF